MHKQLRRVAEPEGDGDKAARPDKNAYYLSDCETLVGTGTWNPEAVTLDSFNKTEGNTSVMTIFKDRTIRSNSIRYTSNVNLDASKGENLKFDFFISDEMIKTKATLEVRLSADGKGFDEYLSYPIDMTKLKAGWNSFDIKLSDLKANGDVSLAKINTFGIYTNTQSYEEMDEVKIKLDNIRFSGTIVELDSINDDNDDDFNFDDDTLDNDDTIDDDAISDDTADDVPTGTAGTATAAVALALMSACICVLTIKKKNSK